MSVLLFKSQGTALTETFSVFQPIDLLLKSEGETEEHYVQGITSTGNWDQQHERVLQEGMNFDPLLRGGCINWNHLPGPENIIGTPLEAAIRETDKGPALWMRGVLYKTKAALSAWELMAEMERMTAKGLGTRRMGWSVEGGVIEREGPIIKKCNVRHMALTHEPVNAETYAELAKSWGTIWTGTTTFDPDHNTHYAFGSFDELAKSMSGVATTQEAQPLSLDNLAGGTTEVLVTLGKDCKKCARSEPRGRRRAIEHLHRCLGIDAEDAYALVKSFVEYLS